MGSLARPPSGSLDPAFWLVASDSPLYLSAHRPDVSLSWALLQAFASSGILLSSSIRLAPTLCRDRLREGHWRLLRSQLPLLTSVGRWALIMASATPVTSLQGQNV